ncbi:OadG family protein [Sulfurovum sp.]|uniref:OadG family protein n=1 Tax=Sulfurovum sp. TaxID=1969726 RepID=UPI0025DF23FD|nr:OadG family protein [Sulfurovum sp.]
MEINLVGESLKFMVLGMLIVFVFLAVLVQVMKLQAKIINKYFPDKAPAVPTSTTTQATDNAHHVAAIVAAISEFRKNKS